MLEHDAEDPSNDTMSRHVIDRVVPQVRYSSSLPVKEVLARLDTALNRKKGEGNTIENIIMTAEPKGVLGAVDAEVKSVIGQHFGYAIFHLHPRQLV
jgi:hypothetical protein